jgi:hypothetical protein
LPSDRTFGHPDVHEEGILPRTPPEVRRIEATLEQRRREEEEKLWQRKQLEEKVQLERRFLRAAQSGASWTEWMDQSLLEWLYGSDAMAKNLWSNGNGSGVSSSASSRRQSSLETVAATVAAALTASGTDNIQSALAARADRSHQRRASSSSSTLARSPSSTSSLGSVTPQQEESHQRRRHLNRQAREARRQAQARDRDAAAKAEADEEAEDKARKERHAQRARDDALFFEQLDQELEKIRTPVANKRTLDMPTASQSPTTESNSTASISSMDESLRKGGYMMKPRQRRAPLNLFGTLNGLAAVVEAATSYVAGGGRVDGNGVDEQPDAVPDTAQGNGVDVNPSHATSYVTDPDDSAAELERQAIDDAVLASSSLKIPESLRAPLKPSPWRDLDDIKPIDGMAVAGSLAEMMNPSSTTTNDEQKSGQWSQDDDEDPLADRFRRPHTTTHDSISSTVGIDGPIKQDGGEISNTSTSGSDDDDGMVVIGEGQSPGLIGRSLRRRRRRRRRQKENTMNDGELDNRITGDMANPRRVLHVRRANYRDRHGYKQLMPDIPGVYRPGIDRMQRRRVLKYAKVIPAFEKILPPVGSALEQKVKEITAATTASTMTATTGNNSDWTSDMRRKGATIAVNESVILNQGAPVSPQRTKPKLRSLASIERLTTEIRQAREPLNHGDTETNKIAPDGIPIRQLLNEIKEAEQPPKPMDPRLAAQRSKLEQMRFPLANEGNQACAHCEHQVAHIPCL